MTCIFHPHGAATVSPSACGSGAAERPPPPSRLSPRSTQAHRRGGPMSGDTRGASPYSGLQAVLGGESTPHAYHHRERHILNKKRRHAVTTACGWRAGSPVPRPRMAFLPGTATAQASPPQPADPRCGSEMRPDASRCVGRPPPARLPQPDPPRRRSPRSPHPATRFPPLLLSLSSLSSRAPVRPFPRPRGKHLRAS